MVFKVKDVLKALTRKITFSDEILSSQHISNALYGLQQMTTESQYVRSLLSIFASKMQKHNFKDLILQLIGNAVYGLHSMDLNPEWCLIINVWLFKSEELLNAVDVSFTDIRTLLQSLLLVSYDDRIPFLKSIVRFDLKGQLNELSAKAWNAFNRALLSLPPAGFQSDGEKKHVKDIISAAQRRQATSTFTTNTFLYGFEADLVQRMNVNGKEVIINYEIDCIHHKLPRKKYFCHLRDEYLQQRGVKVIRKDISWPGKK